MKHILFSLVFFTTSLTLTYSQTSEAQSVPNRQNKTAETDTSKIFEIVENQPEFPGGVNAMMEFIKSNVIYPEAALDKGIEGTAVVQFVVEKDGSLTSVKVFRDPGEGLGQEAERVIALMPKWKPGIQREQTVRVKVSAPIRFRLSKEPPKIIEDNSIYLQADQQAMYPGGEGAMKSYITTQLVIPNVVKKKKIDGISVIYAVVEKNGTLSNIAVQESLCPECDEEAIRIVSAMPVWTPAILKSENVRSVVLIPVHMKNRD